MAVPEILRNLRLPVIAAPMFLVSGIDLVTAACQAGIVGSFPALNARPAEALDGWLTQIEQSAGAKKPIYAVNIVTHQTNSRLGSDLDACVRHRVPILLTSLSAPGDAVKAAHQYGGLVFHDVITLRHAEKAAAQGVDGLILVCAGAGGHTGAQSPFSLIRDIRRFFGGTIVLAGAITSGDGILAAQAMGADLVYIGTRFIATKEAAANDVYKKMVIDAGPGDIVNTNAITGVHANYLRASLAAAGLDPDNLPQPEPRKGYVSNETRQQPKAWRDIWGAGQGVGDINDIPSMADCVTRIEQQYDAAWSRMAALRPATSHGAVHS